MTDANEILVARYTRAAGRAPGIVVRLWAWRVALAIVAVVSTMQLAYLTVWALRAGLSSLVVLIGAHVLAIALAVGLPVRHGTLAASVPLKRIVRGYGDRAQRLRALGLVTLLEFGIQLVLPPVMTLVATHQLRWPAQFVVAGAACLVVWSLQRMAASQRAEASRLSASEP